MSWQDKLVEMARLRGGALQVAQYIAVICGLRRSLDDWVPAEQFRAFTTLVAELGLVMEVDCIFSPLDDSAPAFGLQYAPTTRSRGRPFTGIAGLRPSDEVHVVVAKEARHAAETLAVAWYPLVVHQRVLYKPLIDFSRLGLAFGYPECCVKFFMQHNDWPRQNTIAEAAKASRSVSWKANCLAKNTPWMLIFHMPCAFDCPATLEYSSGLLHEIRGFDGRLADRIEAFLKRTVLVSSERLAFVLEGARRGAAGRIAFTGATSLQQFIRVRDPQHDGYLRALEGGGELGISDGAIFVFRDGSVRAVIGARCDQGVAEVPLILDFGEQLTGSDGAAASR